MKVQTKEAVVTLLQQHKDDIRQYGVSRLGLFGSFVRDTPHNGSDVDLLIEFEQGYETFRNLMDLYFFLAELFGRHTELITPESLSPYIGPRILQEVEYVVSNN